MDCSSETVGVHSGALTRRVPEGTSLKTLVENENQQYTSTKIAIINADMTDAEKTRLLKEVDEAHKTVVHTELLMHRECLRIYLCSNLFSIGERG